MASCSSAGSQGVNSQASWGHEGLTASPSSHPGATVAVGTSSASSWDLGLSVSRLCPWWLPGAGLPALSRYAHPPPHGKLAVQGPAVRSSLGTDRPGEARSLGLHS